MAYKINWDELNKGKTSAPKKSTGVRTVAKAPAKSSAARDAYVKTLGFTPRDMPEFRSDRGKMSGISKAFDILDRPRAGLFNVLQKNTIDFKRDAARNGMGSATVKFAMKSLNPAYNLGSNLPALKEGLVGNTNVTGRSLISSVADDPKVQRNLSTNQKRVVNNNVLRSAGGLALEIGGDPTNAIPIGVALKPIKGISKAVGLTDKALLPASKALKSSHAYKGIVKTLGGGRPTWWKEGISNRDTTIAIGAEIENLSKKMLEKPLSNRDLVAFEALITGAIKRTSGEVGADKVAKKVMQNVRKASDNIASMSKAGKKLDQEELYEYLVGAVPKNVIDATSLSAAKRQVYDEVGKIAEELDGSMAGQRIRVGNYDDGYRYIGQKSSFPDWIPDSMRSRKVIDKVLEKTIDPSVTFRKGSKAQDLWDIVRERALHNTPDEIVDLIKSGGKEVPNELFDKDIADIATAGRSLQDDFVSKIVGDTGAISRETLEKGEGKYLRKYYENPEDLKSAFKQVGGQKVGSRAFGAEVGATKMAKNLPLRAMETMKRSNNPAYKAVLKEYGTEVRKLKRIRKVKGTTGSKNLAILNEVAEVFEPKIKKVLGADYDAMALEARRAAGLVDEANKVLPVSVGQGVQLAANQKLLNLAESVAVDNIDEAGALAQGLKRIPNTAKYGQLKNRFVPDVVYDDIVGILDPSNGIMKQAINNWKKLKLFSPLNFAPNSRNFISDLAANSLVEDGAPVAMQLAMMPRLIQDYWNGGKYMKLLTERGVFASKFSSQEARRILGEAVGQSKKGGVMDLATRATDKFTSKSLNTKIPGIGFGTEAYGYTSDIGKMTQIAYQMEKKGKTIDEAIKIAEKATFDYSKLPVSLRKYRDNLMPFMTYKYFATQLIWDTLINRTGKINKLNHIRRNVEGLSADKANDRDLPQYMKDNRPFYMRMPGAFNDEKDNPRYLDASYLLPMGDVGGTSATDLVFGNPFLKTAIEFGTNKSMFNDQPIVQDTDTRSEKAKKRAMYLISQFGPSAPYMPNAQGDIKLIDAAKRKENSMGNKMDLRYEAPARLAGIRMTDIDPKRQRKYNSYDNKDKITELKGKIKKVKKDKSMSDKKKEKKIKQYKEQIRLIKEY